MHRGYIKIWRKVEDSGLMQMPNTLALFMFLILKATHKDIKMGSNLGVIELNRGQYVSGRKQLASALNQTEREIRTSLSRLHELGIIDQQTTSKYSVYTIVNYGEYQTDDQQTTSTTTSTRPADDQQTTTKQTHKHINTKPKPLCASSDDECADDEKTNSLYTKQFLAFWDLYPNKKSKGDAAKAFAKIAQSNYAAIRNGIEAAKVSAAWLKNNGEFIPHPGTWLRACGWEDEHGVKTSSKDPIEIIKGKYIPGTTPAEMNPDDRQELLRLHMAKMDGRMAA